ncbi:hypothetical protein FPV67DRAFT_1500126 [Lyophyllum atratum]|nr:hypothetical protein FPV67DRAFT_1500126 [Lyophyllum atratum]
MPLHAQLRNGPRSSTGTPPVPLRSSSGTAIKSFLFWSSLTLPETLLLLRVPLRSGRLPPSIQHSAPLHAQLRNGPRSSTGTASKTFRFRGPLTTYPVSSSSSGPSAFGAASTLNRASYVAIRLWHTYLGVLCQFLRRSMAWILLWPAYRVLLHALGILYPATHLHIYIL